MRPFTSPADWPLLGGRYRLVRLLGKGGMGAVFEAEHTLIARRFAIKVLLPELAADAEAVERFRTEAQATGRLASDHVVTVTDFGFVEGAPFLVMELLEGETLASRLARVQQLSPAVAVELLRQACRGAQRAHESGVIHCDIKPRNLFVVRRDDGRDQVRLLDFGIARLLGDAERRGLGRLLGTPSYMSPEQASGDAPIDARTDVYALGVVLYEALSGHLPHPGHDAHAVRCRIARDPPVPLDSVCAGLPADLVQVVHHALARAPAERIPSAAALERELARIDVLHPTVRDDAPGSTRDLSGYFGQRSARSTASEPSGDPATGSAVSLTRGGASGRRRWASPWWVPLGLGLAGAGIWGTSRWVASQGSAAAGSAAAAPRPRGAATGADLPAREHLPPSPPPLAVLSAGQPSEVPSSQPPPRELAAASARRVASGASPPAPSPAAPHIAESRPALPARVRVRLDRESPY